MYAVFADPMQVLKWCLGSTEYGEKYGSVSALAFNTDCSRVLAGYSRGEVYIFNKLMSILASNLVKSKITW